MNTLQPGEYKFNGVESTSLGNSIIQIRPEIHVPKRKVTFIPVPGVSGDYIFDEHAYENTSMNLELISKIQDETVIPELKELIAYTFDTGTYVPLELYFDPDRIYYAKTLNGPNFRMSGQWPNVVLYSMELSIRPFKDWATTYDTVVPSEGLTLINPSNYPAKPIFKLTGTGDMTLTVNDIDYNVQNVVQRITLDSKLEEAYKLATPAAVTPGLLNENHKMMSRDYPIFLPGENTISYSGGVVFLTIEGRWTTLVG